MEELENLVFSSGGIYGISFMGVYSFLIKHNVIPNIKCYSGCSAGAIFALLANLNLSIEEMEEIINTLDYEKYNDINFLDINTSLGFESGKKIMGFIEDIIKNKIGNPAITFNDLFLQTGKKLFINAVCLTDNKIEYFSKDTHPDMEIRIALRMSISIPFIFTPVTYEGKLYVDGGILEYIPNIFPSNSLVIKIEHICTTAQSAQTAQLNLKDYCLKLYLCLFNNLHMRSHIYTPTDVIDIKILDMDLLTFSITPRLKKRLYKYGYRAARVYYNNKINKINKIK